MNEVKRIETAIKGLVPNKALPWIIGQSAHETGYKGKPWNSPVYLRLNNGFGMIQPRRRATLSTGPGSAQPGSEGGAPYATYRNIEDSAKDLVLWLNYNRVKWDTINSPDQYISYIKQKGYFGAPESSYLKGVKAWIKKLNLKVAGIGLGIILTIGLITYLSIYK